jgi:hypothetical protein
MFIGALLLLLGVLMLLQRAGIISGTVWDYFWPAVVIAIGLHLVFKSRRKTS